AKKMIDLASKAKVDAIKFQTFITDKLILKTTPKVKYQKISYNDKEDFYDMIKKYELTKDDFKRLKKYCIKKGLIFLSTPFDNTSVEWLEEIGVPAFKIGSGDMNNFPLLKQICSKGKPILLSTGMATLEEVKESVNYIIQNGIKEIIIFQCTTNYPALYEELNLNVIDTYKREFPSFIIGYGAQVIEKHFILTREDKGVDYQSSLDAQNFIEFIEIFRECEKSIGNKYIRDFTAAELNYRANFKKLDVVIICLINSISPEYRLKNLIK
ncbi:unnamed protein product, partial [marine sediment metagenome]